MNADNPAAIQNVVLQRDDLQNGLLGTCREVSRATAVSNTFLLVKLSDLLNSYLYSLNWFEFLLFFITFQQISVVCYSHVFL